MIGERKSFVVDAFRSAASILCLCALAGFFASQGLSGEKQGVQDRPAIRVLIPNIDDDDGDGLPDFQADVLDEAIEDELYSVLVEPETGLPEGTMLITEPPKPWAPFIRIFKLDPAEKVFRPVQGPVRLNSNEIGRGGVKLAIETSAFAGPDRSRHIEIGFRFETEDGSPISRKTIACSVAPFLMSSCLDPVEAVHVVRTKLTESFVDDLRPLVEEAGARLSVFENASLPEHDIWFQDTAEIGYATDGSRVMHVALHGNRGRELDGLFAKAFLGRDSGVIRPGSFRGRSAEWIDWYGNLEVSPPLKVRDRSHPSGRICAGTQGVRAMHPEVIGFLEAQEVQAPILWLDTSWLVIGHVDEVVSWVPSRTGNAYRLLMPSPRLALEILRKAEKDAPGSVLNRGTRRENGSPGEFAEAPVAKVLNDGDLLAGQAFAQEKIDGVRRTLQAELGIDDADIIEVPVLFRTSPGRFAGRYDALTPNMVNSLLVGQTLIVPDPHGPVVNGVDVLLQAVRDRLEPLGCQVVSIDDFFPYHCYGGEVHCGTNATRLPPVSR